MNIWILFNMISVIIAILLANFVFYLDTKSRMNRLFALATVISAFFKLCNIMALQASGPAVAAFWLKAGSLWPLFLPMMLRFVIIYTQRFKASKNILLSVALYVPAAMIIMVNILTPWLNTPQLAHWGYERGVVGGIMPFYVGVYLWSILMSVFQIGLCLDFYLKSPDKNKKSQAGFILAGLTIQTLLESVSSGLMALLNIDLPDLSAWGSTIMVIFISYAVWRHELFLVNPAKNAENIINTMKDFLILADCEGRILRANPALCSALGYAEPELIGNYSEIMYKNKRHYSRQELEGIMISNMGQKAQTGVETELLTKDGAEIPVLLVVSVIRDLTGGIQGYVWTAMDLTGIKRLENSLRSAVKGLAESNLELERSRDELSESNEKLKSLDVLKNNFISMVSHELRTPMTSIKGYNSFMMSGAGGPLTEQGREFTEAIHKNTARLLKLINELLDVTKIENGTMVLHKKEVRFESVVDSCLVELAPLFSEKGITAIKAFGAGLPAVSADETRIGQVIINLLNNALKFSPGNTRITAEIGAVDGGSLANLKLAIKPGQGLYILACIADEGPGIPAEFREKIFDKFFQISDVKTRNSAGVGLGLAISREIISAHDGFMWVEPGDNGFGSRFCILLPAAA